MPPKIDITGHKYGKLLVIKEIITEKGKRWECVCECGTITHSLSNNLRRGLSSSCGCVGKAKTIQRNIQGATHGMNRHPQLKQMFTTMHARYEITPEWNKSVTGGASFVEWVQKNGWEEGNRYSLIPINADKPVGPNNCVLHLNTPELTGNKYNRLFVLDKANTKNNGVVWNCICECGALTKANTRQLLTGFKQSCGCLKRDYVVQRNKENAIHGLRNHPLYRIHRGMLNRCNDTHNKYYGEKGITVCKEWASSVFSFFTWMISNGWVQGMVLHRKNGKLGYSPENCMLLTKSEHTTLHNNLRYNTRVKE